MNQPEGIVHNIERRVDPLDARTVYYCRASYRGLPFTFVVFVTDAEARRFDDTGSEIRARLRAAFDAKVAELVAVA